MVQILYGPYDHQNRAERLQREIPGSRCGHIDIVSTHILNLDTLTFWGHGTALSLCDKEAGDLLTIIINWKTHNPGLNTVELITCNARHYTDGLDLDPPTSFKSRITSIFSRVNYSYAEQLKRGLKGHNSTDKIKLKALPKSPRGSYDAFSILLADDTHFAYIIAPADDPEPGKLSRDGKMWNGANKIRYMKDGSQRPGNLQVKTEEAKIENPEREWTAINGAISELRNHLEFV